MSKKAMLLGIGGLLAGAGLAVGLVMFLGIGGSSATPAEGALVEPTPVHVEGRLGPHVTLPDRVFTLADPAASPRYAKLEIVLEFETTDPTWFDLTGEALELRIEHLEEELPMALIQDAITTAVSKHTADELMSPEGKDALRDEIHEVVAGLLPEPHIRRVLFTNFITQ